MDIKISHWQKTGKTLTINRPGYNPNDSAMKYVRCHISMEYGLMCQEK
jgi:hypothetical protein